MGLNLLSKLLESVKRRFDVNYIEATVDPHNRAISMQFRLLARKINAEKAEEILFSAADIVELEHDEQLIRIGPLQ